MKHSATAVRTVMVVLLLALFAISCVTPAQADQEQPPVQTEHAWDPSLEDAISRAAADGRLVLMLAGRDTCGNCAHMKNTVSEAATVKPVLLENYVTVYVDVDNTTTWYPYAPNGGFTLPLIAIIDPADPGTALHTTTGIRNELDFLADIQGALE